MVKTVPLKIDVLLKCSGFCINRNIPNQAGFLGRGGRRKESNHAPVQFDNAFLGSKSWNTLEGDLYKRGEKMHEQLFSKEKVMKENLQI